MTARVIAGPWGPQPDPLGDLPMPERRRGVTASELIASERRHRVTVAVWGHHPEELEHMGPDDGDLCATIADASPRVWSMAQGTPDSGPIGPDVQGRRGYRWCARIDPAYLPELAERLAELAERDGTGWQLEDHDARALELEQLRSGPHDPDEMAPMGPTGIDAGPAW